MQFFDVNYDEPIQKNFLQLYTKKTALLSRNVSNRNRVIILSENIWIRSTTLTTSQDAPIRRQMAELAVKWWPCWKMQELAVMYYFVDNVSPELDVHTKS